jgi:ribosomal subunit interface protein
MEVPLQITLRGIESSPRLEELIREKASKLEHVCDRITSCRVAVETAAWRKQSGNPFAVRIDIKVPGHEIVVNREQDEDAYIAVRDAFDAARRQLEDYAHLQRSSRQRAES